MILSGRGFGKTRTGAETCRELVELGLARRIALIGRTAADVRDVMVEGESGILAISPPWNRPKYEPSKRRLTWPNGAVATTYSGDEPDLLRGPQHDFGWADELAAWRYPDAWDQFLFGLRLGLNPRAVVTTTPRPTPIIKQLIADPLTHVTRGSTYANAANLAPAFLEQILKKFEGTRLGRQEIEGAVLDDNPNALWQRDIIEETRHIGPLPSFTRIVVGVDPQIADPEKLRRGEEQTAETGIVVAACTGGRDGEGYVLDDRTVRASPAIWAEAVAAAYHAHKADRIIAEANQGGAMVEATMQAYGAQRGRSLPVTLVHAARGKQTRAEPVSLLYEKKRVHHVGAFPALEDQMCEWEPGMPSPDRMDALVWALTELLVEHEPVPPPKAAAPRVDTRKVYTPGLRF